MRAAARRPRSHTLEVIMRGITSRIPAGVWTVLALALLFLESAPVRATQPPTSFGVEVHGAGSPVLLIPGLSSSGDVWDATVAALEDRYEVHVLSLAGFAGRPAIEGPFLPRVRDDIVAYIRTHQLDRPAVVGHSLGGFMAFWLAASEPRLMGPIVAVDGVPFLSGLMDANATADSVRAMAEGSKAMMASLTQEQFAMQTRMSITAMVTAPDDVEWLTTQGASSDPPTVGQAMFELMTTDLRGDVGRIESPVLLMAAGSAAATPDARARLQANYEAQIAAIPDHRVVVAGEARHFIMLDDPDFFQTTLTGFLADVTDGGRAR